MSFIVMGAEPPKTCFECPLADVEQGWCDRDMVTIIDFDERPVECPISALPDKHGRLVDADALEPDADYYEGDYYAYSVAQVCSAPTIVEAEDEP